MGQKQRPKTGYLATPLSRDEQHRVGRLYREHKGLINLMGRKMCRKYTYVAHDDLFSCIDIAFIKTCRAWDPSKGTFSTLLTVFSEGEIRHFIRDHNWMIKAPGTVRTLGQRARHMINRGESLQTVLLELGVSEAKLREALAATNSVDHEIKDFSLHLCPRPTPWERLEHEEPAS
ncbi:MAG: sigma-70 family RNA polymerase sigma factor [Limnohabitans sp.]